MERTVPVSSHRLCHHPSPQSTVHLSVRAAVAQVAFAALESLHPISHAVANTIKRVVIIVVSVLVFRNPVRRRGGYRMDVVAPPWLMVAGWLAC